MKIVFTAFKGLNINKYTQQSKGFLFGVHQLEQWSSMNIRGYTSIRPEQCGIVDDLSHNGSNELRPFSIIGQLHANLVSTNCCSCRWGETVSLNCDHQQAYCSSPRWYMSMESHGGMIMTGGNRTTRRKTCPSAISSTTKPTWTDPGAKLGHYCERPATNRLSHDTTLCTNNLLSLGLRGLFS
jgi:hypothetical protein